MSKKTEFERDACERAKKKLVHVLLVNPPDCNQRIAAIADQLCAELIEADVLFGSGRAPRGLINNDN